MANIVVMVAGSVVTALYLFAATRIPTMIGDPIGPRSFPYLVAIGLFMSIGWMAIEEVRRRRPAQVRADNLAGPEWPKLYVIGMTIVGTAVYYALIEPLGFVVATIVYLFILSSALDRTRLLLNAIVAVSFSIGLYLVFTKVLKSNLPLGVIFG